VTRLVVHGGSVVTPDGLAPADVVVQDGHIAEVRRGALPQRPAAGDGTVVVDAGGHLVAPGFVDLQCNGALGIDLAREPERLWEIAAALPRWGVTAWLPTIVTARPGTIERALDTLAAGPPPGSPPVARPLGLHLEGPFLAESRRGAHPRDLLRRPESAEIERWRPEEGVALVTVAPELPGALDLVGVLASRGVVVSAGHTAIDNDGALAAVDAGVTWVTHLFNAMAPLHHREPGLAGVALADERLRAGVIADGVHLHPTTVVAAHRALGRRLTLVTDAVAALGMPAGRSRLGRTEIDVHEDGSVRLTDGTLAGSALSLDQAVRNLAAWSGCPVEEAVAAATSTPAAVLGRDDIGAVVAGAPADLVVLDDELRVVTTLVAGRPHAAR
jgi:N-acetylglucosamine-6-phosphate deacetylase